MGDTLILFVRKTADLMIELVTDTSVTCFDMGFVRFFDALLVSSLCDYASRMATTAKILGTPSKLPLWIDPKTMLVSIAGIRSEHALYLNLEAIQSIEKQDQSGVVLFRNGTQLLVPSYQSLLNGIGKARRLKAWLEHHDHNQENAYIIKKRGGMSGISDTDLV